MSADTFKTLKFSVSGILSSEIQNWKSMSVTNAALEVAELRNIPQALL